MNSPLFCYSPTSAATPTLATLADHAKYAPNHSLIDRVRTIASHIEESADSDLHGSFVEIVNEIFGRGQDRGWELDKLKTRIYPDQKYLCSESDTVYYFLSSNGQIFKLCYKLLHNSMLKFNLYFSDIPIELGKKIYNSVSQSYYGSRFLYHMDSNVPIGLILNSFEYYMFHFVLYGLKLTSDDISSSNLDEQQSVYKLLCLEYLQFFLPLDHSAAMILPQLQYNVLSTISKPCTSTSSLLNFIKKDIACNDLSSDKIENSWMLTSEATWRSELLAFYFADIWLNCSTTIPSLNLTKLVRCFIKHLHLYSNCAKHLPVDNLKLILLSRHGIKIYQYLVFYMDVWPQDFSFRLLFENWLCYIQPWRYEDLAKQQYSITESEMNDKWKVFIIKNLLCYTKLFYLAIKRFICIDICSPRYSIMVYRMLKVFTHPYLLKMILDVEHMFINNQTQHKKWNILMSECFVEAEGPLFKYELMFSEERNNEYKLFYTKLQKSLNHVATELNHFREEKMDRNNSSMFELILTPRKNKMSDYTLSEWEDIQINLQSSLLFLEQIINVNVSSTPVMADLSAWSISGLSANNSTSNIFNKSHALIQSFEHSSKNVPSGTVVRSKEWEIDPDFLGTLSYENNILVKISKYLRNSAELYWNSYIIKYSTEQSILAGVLRQTFIRAPMKIFSYEPRNDGSGKRVRMPKIVPPTLSFRWIASYYTITWFLFLMTLILTFDNVIFWIFLFYIFRIIYLCLKYLFGYSPPFVWDNIHEN